MIYSLNYTIQKNQPVETSKPIQVWLERLQI